MIYPRPTFKNIKYKHGPYFNEYLNIYFNISHLFQNKFEFVFDVHIAHQSYLMWEEFLKTEIAIMQELVSYK